MKYFRPSLNQLGKAASFASLAACLAWGAAGTAGAQVLPTSPAPDATCTVPQIEFDTWFANNHPGPNVPVSPADSIAFQPSNNCNFYKWSEHMFLWLTSPATGAYSGSRVFNSSVFYQVSGGALVRQTAGAPLNLALRAAQAGPDGLPVVIDTSGHLREFLAAPGKAGVTALRALGGQGPAGIASVETGSDGKAVFLDAKGHIIKFTPEITAAMLPQKLGRLVILATPPSGKKALTAASERQQIARTLTADHILIDVSTAKGPVFVEAGTGTVDALEPGQAGGNGVLLSQGNSVIFYETVVNDVYAWYLTGRKTPRGIAPFYDNGKDPGLFPTTKEDLQAIEAFSASHGGPTSFPDGDALAMEIKLSWVDAATLPNGAQGYITSRANVPVYTPNATNTQWAPNGSHVITVALVGVHVVGSAHGHPELIWSTFEHQGNTPLAAYQYLSKGGIVTVPQTTAGNWLFSATGAAGPFNTEMAQYCPSSAGAPCTKALTGYIIATSSAGPAGIVPTNILRQKPWGVASNGIPNQEDATPAAANTEVISIDTDIRTHLTHAGATSDPRFNYLFIGSTWTFGGGEPDYPYPVITLETHHGDEIGSSLLLNSTMETFQQGADTTYQTGKNCFVCHTSSGSDPKVQADTDVSHIFGSTSALPLQ